MNSIARIRYRTCVIFALRAASGPMAVDSAGSICRVSCKWRGRWLRSLWLQCGADRIPHPGAPVRWHGRRICKFLQDHRFTSKIKSGLIDAGIESMFELSQLRCFVAVAEELNFGRAAERLNMTQPPLSRQIQLLEHHVGTRLLERSSRVVKLTAAGRGFLPEAARIVRLSEEAAVTARRMAAGDAGSLAIGFTASVGYGLLPLLVRSEEHTSELQSPLNLVCRLLLEKKK